MAHTSSPAASRNRFSVATRVSRAIASGTKDTLIGTACSALTPAPMATASRSRLDRTRRTLASGATNTCSTERMSQTSGPRLWRIWAFNPVRREPPPTAYIFSISEVFFMRSQYCRFVFSSATRSWSAGLMAPTSAPASSERPIFCLASSACWKERPNLRSSRPVMRWPPDIRLRTQKREPSMTTTLVFSAPRSSSRAEPR